MGEVYFYHLTRRPLEAALPELLVKTLERGWRAVVRVGNEARLADLNRHLWTFSDESFLPHGAKGDGDPERQPIYLTTGAEIPNGADALFLVDAAEASFEEAARLTRLCLIFSGADETALGAARRFWKALGDTETPAVYYAEEARGWVKKQERKPSA